MFILLSGSVGQDDGSSQPCLMATLIAVDKTQRLFYVLDLKPEL